MLIWMIVIVVLGVLGVTGYYKGAIRSLVSLIGLFLAMFLSLPLSPALRPLVPKVGITNPVLSWLLPPAVVFLLFVLVFTGVAFFLHYKLVLFFKYKTDDYVRQAWERLNRRLGLCVGLVGGGIYIVLVGLLIYIFGYPAVQVTSDDSPAGMRFLSKARLELHEAGLDRTLAAIDPMPEYFYLASDVLGLLYNNHPLWERVATYPAFLALGDRAELQDIATDVDLQGMLQTKAPVITIVNHAKIQTVINNSEIMQELRQTDLKDLYQYLKSGKSAKYDEVKILGRWRLDTAATLTLERKKNPDITPAEMKKLRLLVMVFLEKVSFMATPDNRAFVKMDLSEEAKKMIEAAKAAAAPRPTEDGAAPGAVMDSRMAMRYGLRPRTGAPTPTPAPAATPAAPALPVPDVNLASQGTWERDGDKYKLKLKDEKGKDQSADATADEERMVVMLQGHPMVFVR